MRIARVLVLGALALFTLLPLLVMVSTSVRPAVAARQVFTLLPPSVTLRGYADMWQTIPLARYLANSLIVAGVTTAVALLLAVPAGYALARWRFRGRTVLTIALLSTQAVPGLVFCVPLFIMFVTVQQRTGLQLAGSHLGLVLADLCFTVPIGVWLLARYVEALPVETEQAAALDGAGPLGVLYRIVVPAARPGIVAVGVLTFTVGWGEVLFASVLSDSRTRTLAVGLSDYAAGFAPQWNQLMAAALTAALPAVAAFCYLQRVLVPASAADAGRPAGGAVAGRRRG